MSFEYALNIVKAKRPIVHPNVGFVEQLKLFEEMKWEVKGNSPAHKKYQKIKGIHRICWLLIQFSQLEKENQPRKIVF